MGPDQCFSISALVGAIPVHAAEGPWNLPGTGVEVHGRPGPLRPRRLRVNIIPPGEAIARHASRLPAAAGPRGHKHVPDAIVAIKV